MITYTDNTSGDNPRDFLTREERTQIREAALEHGSIPHYNSLTPAERDEWKAYLAQRFEKPKEDVGKQDWKRANSFKVPSLVWTAMDAGLRPVEVGRMQTGWIDTDNGILRILREDSPKNSDNWTYEDAEPIARWEALLRPNWAWEAYETVADEVYYGRVASPWTYDTWEWGYFTHEQLEAVGAYHVDCEGDEDGFIPDGGGDELARLVETELAPRQDLTADDTAAATGGDDGA